MKKLNNKGFVLAETLVVTVFLMVLFTMLYSNFYPLIGEYEKRETYDDVDGKYVAYWIKKLVEDSSYNPSDSKKQQLKNYGYMRFECGDVSENDEQRTVCRRLVKELEISGCDQFGNSCEVFITNYRIGGTTPSFKDTVKLNDLYYYNEECTDTKEKCVEEFVEKCSTNNNSGEKVASQSDIEKCMAKAQKHIFNSAFQDYVASLADFTAESLNQAEYRVIVSVHHTKDNNNYYSYSTIEVNK